MKKIIVSLVAVLVLGGCGGTSEDSSYDVDAESPTGFIKISETDNDAGDITELKHVKTGCHYSSVDGMESLAFTQMFIKENGVSVPYCD